MILLTGCSPSKQERDQQVYWERKANDSLAKGMSKWQVLSWAESNDLTVATSDKIVLFAKMVPTRWPNFPCAETATVISLTFDKNENLERFNLGRAGACL